MMNKSQIDKLNNQLKAFESVLDNVYFKLLSQNNGIIEVLHGGNQQLKSQSLKKKYEKLLSFAQPFNISNTLEISGTKKTKTWCYLLTNNNSKYLPQLFFIIELKDETNANNLNVEYISCVIQALANQVNILEKSYEQNTEFSIPKELPNTNIDFLLKSINGVSWRLNIATKKFIFIGSMIEDILGYSTSDWQTFDDWLKCVHPEDKNWASDYFKNSHKLNNTDVIKYRIIKKDKSIINVKDVVQIKTDEKGNVIELFGYIINVSSSDKSVNFHQKQIDNLHAEKYIFQKFADSFESFVSIKDIDGRIIYANQFYNKFPNKSQQSILGCKLKDYLSGNSLDELKSMEHKTIKKKQTCRNTIKVYDEDKNEYWFYVTYFPFKDNEDKVYAIGTTAIDISKRMQYEQQLEDLSNQFNLVLKATETEVSIIDENGNIIFQNNENKTVSTQRCFEHYRGLKDKCEDCPRRLDKPEKRTFFYSPPENPNKTIQVTAIPFLSKNGKLHMAESRVDITERVQQENENKDLKNKLDFAMNIGRIAYVEYNFNTGLFTCSEQYKNIIGYDLNQKKINYEWFSSRMHPDDIKFLRNDRLRNTGSNEYNMEYRFRHKNGNYVWLRFRGQISSSTDDSSPTRYSGIIYDITKEKQLLNDLTKERNRSLEANKAKSSFLSNMSHEIRTPMNAIIGFSELLKKHIDKPQLVNYLNSISTSGKMLLDLINDMLDLSKIEAGKMQLATERVEFITIINDLVTIYDENAKKKNICLSASSTGQLPSHVILDPLRFKQVLINLISNAIKFTSKGSIEIKYSFNYTDEDCGMLELSVNDTGIGIHPDKQNEIFKPFIQSENINTKKHQGTGLGLAITNQLVGLMNGEIALESEINKGSTFTVTIPVKVSGQNGINDIQIKKIDQQSNASIRFNEELVLIVDDIASNRDVLKDILTEMNLKTIAAKNGKDALELLKSNKPNLILMDIRMPILNGFETIEIIKQEEQLKKIPIIAISASTLRNEVEEIYEKGFDDFLPKPVIENDLVCTLKKFITPIGNATQEQADITTEIKKHQFTSNELETILAEFESNIIPLWNELKIVQPMAILAGFNNEIMKITQVHKWEDLSNYQNALQSAIEAYDFEEIKTLVPKFEKIILTLKKQNK